MAPLFSPPQRCPECRKKLEPGANFCACGAPVRDFRRTCHHCHRVVDARAEKCAHCGARLEEVEPHYVLVRWARRPREFARRIDVVTFAEGQHVHDPRTALQGALDGGVTVDAGTRALLLVNGRIEADLPPGWTSATSDALSVYAGEDYVRTLTVIAVDAGDTELEWRFPSAEGAAGAGSGALALTTRDGFRVAVRVGVAVGLADAAALATNLLKEQAAISIGALAEWLRPVVGAAVRELVGKADSADLAAPASAWRSELEVALRDRLQRDLTIAGLRLERLRDFAIESPRLKELEEDREQSAVIREKAGEARARLEHIEKLQDAIVRKHKIDDAALLEIEKSKLFTAMEMEELRRAQEDEKLGWQRARAILDARHRAEVQEIERRTSLTLHVEEAEAEIGLARKRRELDAEMAEREREHEARIAMELREAKNRHKLEMIREFKDWESPEKILAALAGISPDAAETLRAKFSQASAEERVALLKEMQDKLFALQAGGRQELVDVQKEAMRGMADVAAAKASTRLVPCPHCRVAVSAEVAECPACRRPMS